MTGAARATALLQAARDFIAVIPPLALLNGPRRSGQRLVADIDRFLVEAPWQEAPPDIVEEVRARWRGEATIHVDDHAVMRSNTQGLWIGAWVRVGSSVQPLDGQQFRQALDSLPLMQREVYILHRVEGRTLEEIAKRLGLTALEIEALFFAALRGLHAAIYGQQT